MLHLKRILDLDQLRGEAFPPPQGLLDRVEELEARGEPWWVLEAWLDGREEPTWLAVFPEDPAAVLYADGEQMEGQWDEARRALIPEEGNPVDLQGHPVSLDSLESEEEDEDAAWWEEARARRLDL